MEGCHFQPVARILSSLYWKKQVPKRIRLLFTKHFPPCFLTGWTLPCNGPPSVIQSRALLSTFLGELHRATDRFPFCISFLSRRRYEHVSRSSEVAQVRFGALFSLKKVVDQHVLGKVDLDPNTFLKKLNTKSGRAIPPLTFLTTNMDWDATSNERVTWDGPGLSSLFSLKRAKYKYGSDYSFTGALLSAFLKEPNILSLPSNKPSAVAECRASLFITFLNRKRVGLLFPMVWFCFSFFLKRIKIEDESDFLCERAICGGP